MNDQRLLADVGGTNSRVGVADGGGILPGSLRSIPNAEFDGLGPLLAAYLEHMGGQTPRLLCAGVAGPVRGETAQLTNRTWQIDIPALRKATGVAKVALINDLQAQGYALDDLAPGMVEILSAGEAQPTPGSTRLVIGLGTGCNVAAVHCIDGDLFVPPSEAGHTGLPFVAGPLTGVIEALTLSQPHLPVESFLSGPGLARLHQALSGQMVLPADILRQCNEGHAKAATTVQIFAQVLGTVTGNFALMHLPMGGIFLIGGFARAIAPFLINHGFREIFDAKGPYCDIMRDIPIHVIHDDNAALLGCRRYSQQTFG